MAKYIVKRLLMLIFVVVGVTFLIFTILCASTSNPGLMILGMDASKEEVDAKNVELGWDKPIIVRYVNYMTDAVQGDFGTSWRQGYEVKGEFLSRLPTTLQLGILSLFLSTIIGVPLGVIAAVRQYHIVDYITLAGAMILSSVPAFWLGLILQMCFCLNISIFPAISDGSFYSLILPAICLCAATMAAQVRMTRSSMLDVIKQEYIRTARAKGATEKRVVIRHVVRNGLLPVITGIGMGFATLIGGSVVIETVFSVPGTGMLLINAVKTRDIPVVMGSIIFISLFVGVVNLLVDIIYAFVDPRVKFGTKK